MSRSEVLLLVTGSIAAYKACHVVSRLVQAGYGVQVAASSAALRFVGEATWEGLSGRPVAKDLWESGHAMEHIHLVRKADLILAAPASAHFLNRIAAGIGDDLMTTMFLAHDFKKPFLVAPAMNTMMYTHPVTQDSLRKLKSLGLEILETASGVLACGENGYGRLLDPDLIVKEVEKSLDKSGKTDKSIVLPSPTPGAKILITAGGTREPIDDVRAITNTSTGSSGARLADELSELGFDVTLLRAKTAARPNSTDVKIDEFETFADLEARLRAQLAGGFSHVIHMAAVSDYSIARVLVDGRESSGSKTPSGAQLTLELKPNPKLIASLRDWGGKGLRVVGFKLTSRASDEDRRMAETKVLAHADLVIGNDLSEIDEAKGIHPYVITSGDRREPVAGFAEMSARLAQWIVETSTGKGTP